MNIKRNNWILHVTRISRLYGHHLCAASQVALATPSSASASDRAPAGSRRLAASWKPLTVMHRPVWRLGCSLIFSDHSRPDIVSYTGSWINNVANILGFPPGTKLKTVRLLTLRISFHPCLLDVNSNPVHLLCVLQREQGHYYGYVYFRQVRDKSLKRGYFQKVSVFSTLSCWSGKCLHEAEMVLTY